MISDESSTNLVKSILAELDTSNLKQGKKENQPGLQGVNNPPLPGIPPSSSAISPKMTALAPKCIADRTLLEKGHFPLSIKAIHSCGSSDFLVLVGKPQPRGSSEAVKAEMGKRRDLNGSLR